MKLVFALLALSGCACAQTRDPVTDGMMQGALIANQILQAQQRQAEADRLRAETEAMREQTAAAREARRRAVQTEANAKPAPRMVTNDEWNGAVKRVTALHPDFNDYRPVMVALLPAFPAGNVALPDYLEGLYLIARYASFAPPATAPPAK
jgi:ADP-ribosylglycohydrolase